MGGRRTDGVYVRRVLDGSRDLLFEDGVFSSDGELFRIHHQEWVRNLPFPWRDTCTAHS